MKQYDMEWIKPRLAEFRAWLDTKPNLDAGSFDFPDAIWALWANDVTEFNGWFHLSVSILAKDIFAPEAENECLIAAHKALEILAHGHLAVIRDRPVVDKEINFETAMPMMRGYVRFGVHCDEGDWHDAPRGVSYMSFGS